MLVDGQYPKHVVGRNEISHGRAEAGYSLQDGAPPGNRGEKRQHNGKKPRTYIPQLSMVFIIYKKYIVRNITSKHTLQRRKQSNAAVCS